MYSRALNHVTTGDFTIHSEDLEQVVQCYCNRSLAYAKMNEFDLAYQDAVRALDALKDQAHVDLKMKAYHRKAQALIRLDDRVEALRVYKEALEVSSSATEGVTSSMWAATYVTLQSMPHTWIAEYWMKNVVKGEAPHPLSTRDCVLLKKIPASKKLSEDDFKRALLELLDNQPGFAVSCRASIAYLWAGTYTMKSCCSYIRGSVYLKVGEYDLAERDATVALVYGPQTEDGMRACWADAYGLRGRCYEKRGDNVHAVLDILQAMEFAALENIAYDANENEGGESMYSALLDTLLPRIPEHYANAIQNGCGYVGLERMMSVERERMQPEFMRKRPKYYYYYEWMKKRIVERHPEISDGVMDKLLTLDATELDLLLKYPQAIDNTVHELEGVLKDQGGDALETYKVPLLTWGELQDLKSKEQSLPSADRPAITSS